MKVLITTVLLLTAHLMMAQNLFLTIDQGATMKDQASYPPGTPFQLTDRDNQVVFSWQSAEGVFKIDQPYTLTLNPTWKDTPDTYYLKEGALIFAPAPVYKKKANAKTKSYSSNGITVEKKLTNSQNFYGLKNVELTFSNGVVFTYVDQKATATLNGKPLEVTNKYLIYSSLGIHKVSFNPSKGKVYWVFEPIN